MSIFGPEFEKIWPQAGTTLQLSDFGKKLLKQCENIKKPEQKDVDLDEFKRKSSNFPLEFGTNTCRVISQPKDRYPNIQKQISSAYPVIHERVLQLYLDFLEHKCQYGHPKERELYVKLSLEGFIQRLLTKRCAAFVGPQDAYLLINGCKGFAEEQYVSIGTDDEQEPLIFQNCLSYDEAKLSAFLSISSHSELINNGTRQNCGIIEKDLNKIEREGVVIGIIGARFQKPLVMDYQDIVISPEQNIPEMGYGPQNTSDIMNTEFIASIEYRKLWEQFYEESGFLYTEVKKDNKRFGDVEMPCFNEIFDNVVMKKRFTISFDTLLLEAQARAFQLNKQAYVHVVGIGLGVWRMAKQQSKIFLETFDQRVKHLLPKLNNIGVIHFSWFEEKEWADLKHNGLIESKTHPMGGIRTLIANRNPADKLNESEFENMLLVISYAWDGNALPGNEFWFKHLDDSSDSSNACSTLVTELHNPFINTEWVCGKNLHIASAEYGVIHISEYAKNFI
ncbi:ADP-ribosylarginine hydrolase CG2909-like isoform X1 [Haematobia irritans]|uniref:ADP-ribosylarginine hydrolase CG2909-like isoform X1 n=1 Tax=Haematobia irritans TaxID=7368 RepID=UPI003F501610